MSFMHNEQWQGGINIWGWAVRYAHLAASASFLNSWVFAGVGSAEVRGA